MTTTMNDNTNTNTGDNERQMAGLKIHHISSPWHNHHVTMSPPNMSQWAPHLDDRHLTSTPTYPVTKRAQLATRDISWALGPFFFFLLFFTILTFIYLFMIRPHCLTLTCLTPRPPCWHFQPAPKRPPDDEKGSRCISSPCYVLPHHHLAHHHQHQHNQSPEYVTLGKGEHSPRDGQCRLLGY